MIQAQKKVLKSFDSIAYVFGALAISPVFLWPTLFAITWTMIVGGIVFGLHRRLYIKDRVIVERAWFIFSQCIYRQTMNRVVTQVKVFQSRGEGVPSYSISIKHQEPDKPSTEIGYVIRRYDIFCVPAKSRAIQKAEAIGKLIAVPIHY